MTLSSSKSFDCTCQSPFVKIWGLMKKRKRIYEAGGSCFLIKSCMGFSALFIILLGYYKRFLVIF